MASWGEFAEREPEIATAGRRLFYQYGPGLAFLATVSRGGFPRLHPINIALTSDELYAFVVPGPKLDDLDRDGAYALHAPLPDRVEEEFMVGGRAYRAPSSAESEAALAAYHISDVPPENVLFRFDIERALHAAYRFRGDWPPTYRHWRASRAD